MKRPMMAWFIISLLAYLTACQSMVTPTVTPSPEPTITTAAPPSGQTVRIGVLAIRSAVAANAQYGPIIAHLQKSLNRPVELVPLDQETQFSQVLQNNLDFIFNNPLAAVQLRRIYKTEFLATLSRANTGSDLSGLIIVNAKSNITTLSDLKGKRGTCVAFQTAAAGCVFQLFHLKQHGLDPFKEFSRFVETTSQDNIVLGVLNDTFDVGFIRTGQLEKMVLDGTLANMEQVHILDQAKDDFYYPHTTALYPEWPFAALPETDPALKVAAQKALLELTADHALTIQGEHVWFVPARDYKSLDDLIVTLKLLGWDAK